MKFNVYINVIVKVYRRKAVCNKVGIQEFMQLLIDSNLGHWFELFTVQDSAITWHYF